MNIPCRSRKEAFQLQKAFKAAGYSAQVLSYGHISSVVNVAVNVSTEDETWVWPLTSKDITSFVTKTKTL